MRHLLRTAALLLLITALPAATANAAADPPDASGVVERVQLPWAPTFADPEAGLVVSLGVPAEEGCLGEDYPQADYRFLSAPSGALMFWSIGRFTAYVYEASSVEELCALALTTGIDPVAVGDDVRVGRRDNFLNYEPGSRTNVFGSTAQGTVHDADGGAWSLHAVNWQQLDRDGNYSERTTVRLVPHGG